MGLMLIGSVLAAMALASGGSLKAVHGAAAQAPTPQEALFQGQKSQQSTAQGPADLGQAVRVAISPHLEARAEDLGQADLDDLASSLRTAVARALQKSRALRPLQVDLVLEDVRPNRPTIAEQAKEPSLSIASKSLGGARISGVVTYPGGVSRPLREQFYQSDLSNVQGLDRWQDADRAIQQTALDLAAGRFPAVYVGPGPTGRIGFRTP